MLGSDVNWPACIDRRKRKPWLQDADEGPAHIGRRTGGGMENEKYSVPLDLKNVNITDGFWGREQELVRREVIPYQWDALNDEVPDAAPSYCMRNFRVAGRMMSKKREEGAAFEAPSYTFRGFQALPEDPKNPDPDKFYGFVFQDSDFAKWIEAVGYSLINHPDPELEKIADGAIDIVCAAQADNGYLDTYYIINGMDRIFTNLRDHHELYCFGHLAEGAVSYYQATGKDKLLKAVERYADFICSQFGPEEGKKKGYPGHEIAEMALTRLYELTGEKKYLELACFFLDMRGGRPYYFDLEEKERAAYENRPYREPGEEQRFHYHQAHMPVRQQSEAVGHAVRAVYLYSGMADAARLTGDSQMLAACRRIWDSIVKEKLYVTGGIGGTHVGEAFSFPYDLPNDTAYSETCAAIGLAFFARRMLQIEARSEYGDVMEQALYNTVLAGMALDGKSFFYVNPLEVDPEACRKDERKRHVQPVRQKWFGCACCPPNIARIASSVGAYAYTQSPDTLYTHLYVGSRISFSLNGRAVDMSLESGFPWEGGARAALHIESGVCHGSLAFRIPGWCRTARVWVCRSLKDHKGLESHECSSSGTREDGTAQTDTLVSCTMTRVHKEMEIVSAGERQGEVREHRHGEKAAGHAEAAGPREEGLSPEGEMGCGSLAPLKLRLEKGYLYLAGDWQDGDRIYLDFSMEVRCVGSGGKVRENMDKVAFVRGPVCYCMEEADNGKRLWLLRVDKDRLSDRPAMVETSTQLGHEMCILKVPGLRQEPDSEAELYEEYKPAKEKETTLTFIPYYAWSNRGEGEMSVWVRI